MATCPNKSLQEWKDLVKAKGEDMAYYIWAKYDGNVPHIEYMDESSKDIVQELIKPVRDAIFAKNILSEKDNVIILSTAERLLERNFNNYTTLDNNGIINLNVKKLSKEVYKELGDGIISEETKKDMQSFSDSMNDVTGVKQRVDKYIKGKKETLSNFKSIIQKLKKTIETKDPKKLFKALVYTPSNEYSLEADNNFDLKDISNDQIYNYVFKNGRLKAIYKKVYSVKKSSVTGKESLVLDYEYVEEDTDDNIGALAALEKFSKNPERLTKAINVTLIKKMQRSINRINEEINNPNILQEWERDQKDMNREMIQMNEGDIRDFAIENTLRYTLMSNNIINDKGELTNTLGFNLDSFLDAKRNESYNQLKAKQTLINKIINNKEDFNSAQDNYESQFEDGDVSAPIPGWFIDAVSVNKTGKLLKEHVGFMSNFVRGWIMMEAQREYDAQLDKGKQPNFMKLAEETDLNSLLPDGARLKTPLDFTNSLAIMNQLKRTEGTQASPAKLEQIKEAAKKMGIRFNTLTEYAKQHSNIDVSDANALADLLQGVVAIAEGKEDVALTEEVVHIATAIIEQVSPSIISNLIKKIGKYQIYKDTLKQYRNNKYYQTSEGKPDIRKIKKEALDKLLAEVIIRDGQDLSTFPELGYDENMNMFQKIWESLKQAIRSLYKQSDVDLFKQTAANISMGNVGGTVDNLQSDEVFLQTKTENEAVNNLYSKILDIEKDLVLVPEVKDAQGNIVKKRHYLYKGKEIDQTVTEKLSKNKDFKDIPDSEDKMMWGSKGHEYIDEYIRVNLLDKNGYKKKKTNTRISTPLNSNVRTALQLFAEELIDSYPEGTRFLTEVKAVNTQVKGGLASTIDFMALVPTEDNDVKIDILDWKFTSFKANEFLDLSPGKQKAWKMQMGEYVKMMKSTTYKVPSKNIRKARMIPFVADYRYNIPGVSNSGLVLSKIEIGNVDPRKENKLHLLPVATDEEITGNKKIDNLISGLRVQQVKMYKKYRDHKKREQKESEMVAIRAAIKKLRVKYDFDPLYSVGRDLNNRVEKYIENIKKIKFDDLTKIQVNGKLDEMIEYQHSLEKFIELREIYNSYLNKDDDKLTKEERTTLAKINNVSNKATSLNKQLIEIQNRFVKNKAVALGEVLEENKDDVLKPEVIIDNLSYSFLEGSRLPARIIRMASNLILKASNLVDKIVNDKIKDFGVLINDLEKQASSQGVKAFDLIGEVKENDLRLINKIRKEYYDQQKEAIENNDKAFFKKNMDLNSYKKMVSKLIKERYAIIDETIYTSDINENLRRRKFAKESFKNKIDIFSKDFTSLRDSYFLYIYKQNFLEEKHYSEKFKELKKNDTAYKVWEYFMNLNKEARDLGYLEREAQSFFPLIEATSLQKLQQTKNYAAQGVDFFKDVYMSRINESMEYNTTDPETGEVKKSIPKYFTRTDKKVEQLSRDLNLVGAMWIRSVEEYKNAKELEHTLHTMHIVEKAKGHIVQEGGKTVYNGSNIVTKDDNTQNARVLQRIIEDFLYNKRESASSVGNKVIDFSVGKVVKNEEEQERVGVNVRKTINSANDLVRLLALGAKVPLGVANWVGTQMQSFIKSGKFYKFREYEKAHAKVTFSDLNTMSLEEKAAIDLFVPLNDDTALEARRKVAKERGLIKYLSTWSFTDVMMLTMQFPEKKLQFANALAILNNTVVIDGKIENARQYIRKQDRLARKNGADFNERANLRKSKEDRIKALIEEHGINKKIKITDSGISIPGVSNEEIARYRTLIIDYNRTLNGMMDENDKMGFRRDTLFSSFMMFKSWIPKLVYVRTGKLEKNLQTGEWDYGRMRAFLKTVLYDDVGKMDIEGEKTRSLVTRWGQSVRYSTKKLKDIIYMTDDGIELMNNILYEKKLKHFKETGQQLEISEEEFQDVIREAVIGQFKELAVLAGVMSSYIGMVAVEPPEDATPFEKNKYKWYFRQINKIADEITFYYKPGSTESMLEGTFIPAIGLIAKVERFVSQLGAEVYGRIEGDKDMVEDAHPTKYFFNLIPILSQGQNEYLPYIDPELAKEMGIRVTKEARR